MSGSLLTMKAGTGPPTKVPPGPGRIALVLDDPGASAGSGLPSDRGPAGRQGTGPDALTVTDKISYPGWPAGGVRSNRCSWTKA
jgi:hypothetical protein